MTKYSLKLLNCAKQAFKTSRKSVTYALPSAGNGVYLGCVTLFFAALIIFAHQHANRLANIEGEPTKKKILPRLKVIVHHVRPHELHQ
ncbi:MAG: hypothetical protein ACI4D6_07075, partial [Chordicoccus sp.]